MRLTWQAIYSLTYRRQAKKLDWKISLSQRRLSFTNVFWLQPILGIIQESKISRLKTGLSEKMNRKKIPPIHPGEILDEEFLKPMEISQNQL
jgi:hypothetical protein